MEQVDCLNLCELLSRIYNRERKVGKAFEEIRRVTGVSSWNRIYVGSYFCSQYFLHMEEDIWNQLMEKCREKQIKVTLVIPMFTQKDLVKGKEKIKQMSYHFGKEIDEITVNDFGMLQYIAQQYSLKMNMGRLFMKDYRDPRYVEYFQKTLTPKINTKEIRKIIEEYHVVGLEFDPTHLSIDLSSFEGEFEIGMHTPYCYITVGQICEYASISKKMEQKYRPNQPCMCECQDHLINYETENQREWIRLGRTIYFANRECKVIGTNRIRMIYFPLDLEMKE